MKPIFKYSGGKSRELKTIKKLIPNNFNRVIEPFAGSVAVSFGIEKPMVLNDIRHNNMATFRAVQNKEYFEQLMGWVSHLSTLAVDELEKVYYEQRDGMWQKCETDLDYAKRWIVIRQLTFSGIDRINTKTGKFNAPFGWYKKFNCNLSSEHHELLKKSTLLEGDFTQAFDISQEDDFIFLDPPYFKRNSAYGGDYDEKDQQLHKDILDQCKKTKSKWMMVHIDCPLYRELYSEFNIYEKDFAYSQNFKGRDNSSSKVVHLYITNYEKEDYSLTSFLKS